LYGTPSIWIELTGMGVVPPGVAVAAPGTLGRLQPASPAITMIDAKNFRIIFSLSLDMDKVSLYFGVTSRRLTAYWLMNFLPSKHLNYRVPHNQVNFKFRFWLTIDYIPFQFIPRHCPPVVC